MQFNFASEGTSNSYFDRIIQTAVDVELRQMVFCLESCKIAHRATTNSDLSLNQKLCLEDCTYAMSLDLSQELTDENK